MTSPASEETWSRASSTSSDRLPAIPNEPFAAPGALTTVTMDGSDTGDRDAGFAAGPESVLLARIAGGDRGAFRELFGVYYRRLWRFCTRLLSDRQLVEEVVNDTMMVVWRKAGSFDARSRVSTWIFGIAYRIAMKALALRQSRASVIEYHGEVRGEAAPGIAMQLEDSEGGELLEAALQRLSPEHRAVLELAYVMGYSCAEIAAIAKCPVNTVKTRLFNARGRLKALWPAPEARAKLEETME